jgi:hypothetical protein
VDSEKNSWATRKVGEFKDKAETGIQNSQRDLVFVLCGDLWVKGRVDLSAGV